jgi:NADH-quinone oxidoreductase subunit C
MNNIQLAEFVKSIDPALEAVQGKQFTEITLAPDKLHSFAMQLRDHQEALFDFLFCLSGVDYGQDLGVVYHLRSTVLGHTLVLKVRTSDREHPQFDTVSDIWKTADFHEREAFDLFGIRFNNHPDLRRLFLDSSWGFPFRKDYVDEINIVTK